MNYKRLSKISDFVAHTPEDDYKILKDLLVEDRGYSIRHDWFHDGTEVFVKENEDGVAIWVNVNGKKKYAFASGDKLEDLDLDYCINYAVDNIHNKTYEIEY